MQRLIQVPKDTVDIREGTDPVRVDIVVGKPVLRKDFFYIRAFVAFRDIMKNS